MRSQATAIQDVRAEPRDEVMHRTRATNAQGEVLKLVLVNISASGLMARCEGSPAAGERLRVELPIVGMVDSQVRWSLGGRIGCELDRTIPLGDYYNMLSVMLRTS